MAKTELEIMRPLPGGLGKALSEALAQGERVHASIQGVRGEALVVTDSRAIVIKAFIGGRKVRSFPLEQISSVELSRDMFHQRLEILAPGVQPLGSKGPTATGMAEHAVVFHNASGTMAGPAEFVRVAQMIRTLIEDRRKANEATTPAPGLTLTDLEKLGELRDKGYITPEEFEVKKRQILGL